MEDAFGTLDCHEDWAVAQDLNQEEKFSKWPSWDYQLFEKEFQDARKMGVGQKRHHLGCFIRVVVYKFV